MADKFCTHGQTTGSNTGADRTNTYRDLFAAVAALSSGDHLHITEHAGIDCDTTGIAYFKIL